MADFKIVISSKALKEYQYIHAAGLAKKLKNLLEILAENPFQSPPSYEKLVLNLDGYYSRRLNRQHRLVYMVDKEKKIDLIIIDYLQMMSGEGFNSEGNRQQEITQISRYLKQLAREMQCPVIVLSQLSRAVEQRQGDKKPILSDLRESGAIEQDADVVMFLYREDYYNRDKEPTNICEVIIAKQRMGETGTVKLTWMPRFTKFANIQKEPAV